MNKLEEHARIEEIIELQEQAIEKLEELRKEKPYFLGLAYLNQLHSKEQLERVYGRKSRK